jgi:cephalosporin hydroxylase
MLTITPPSPKLVEAVRERLEAVWMPGDWFELTPQVVMHYAWKGAVYLSAVGNNFSPPVIEIGTRCGYSMHAFDAAGVSGGGFYIGGIDENEPVLCFDGAIDDDSPRCLAHFREQTERMGISADLVVVNTKNVLALPTRFFAHVDGDHTYTGCLHDLHLVAGSHVILADDCDNAGVRSAVAAFVNAHPGRSVQFVNDGLRTLGVISWHGPTGPSGKQG